MFKKEKKDETKKHSASEGESCPLCKVSEETLKALKEKAKQQNKKHD